ncbi:hypothetical protein KKC91_09195 [bacterium]|nr:hypothetical protein [bacterium]
MSRNANTIEFFPISEANKVLTSTLRTLRQRVATVRITITTPRQFREEWRKLIKAERMGAGLVIFDNDAGITQELQALVEDIAFEGGRPDIRELVKGIIFDHHGLFYDPENPEVNSVMQVLDYIENVLQREGNENEKIAFLKQAFQGNISTDNIGDGSLALWICYNLDEIIDDAPLRKKIRYATWVEDFGLFQDAVPPLASVQDPDFREGIGIGYAMLNLYNRVLQEYGVKGSDRFGQLKREVQKLLINDVLEGITDAIYDVSSREAGAGRFLRDVERAKSVTSAAHKSFMREVRTFLKREGLDLSVLDDIYIVLEDPSGSNNGLFADWVAGPGSHTKPIHLALKPLAPSSDGNPRFQMILSVVSHGKEQKMPSLAALGQQIQEANLKKASRMGILEGQAGAVFGRDAVQVAFGPGLLLLPKEILKVVADFYQGSIDPFHI